MVRQWQIILCTLLAWGPVFSQSDNIISGKLIDSFENQAKNSRPLLIYLQTSKSIYETGEDLWFKAYVLDAQYLIPSDTDHTLYVQLIREENNKAVWEERYRINQGFANGQVYLPESLEEGDYLLAAYSSHSFYNRPEKFFAFRKIRIKEHIVPQLLIDHEFSKRAYSNHDAITLDLTIQTKQRDTASYADIDAQLWQGDRILRSLHTKTNKYGKTRLAFSRRDTIKGLRVKLKARYEGKEQSLILKVPAVRGKIIRFSMFPEGGNIVSGVESKIAFKTVNDAGEPVHVKGILYSNGDSLLSFESLHAGMGSFCFIPDSNKNYSIKLFEPSIDSVFLLPEIKKGGLSMELTDRNKDVLIFKIAQDSSSIKQRIYLRLQMRGLVYSAGTGIVKNKLLIKIPLDAIPQGIAEVTLFNKDLYPVAERLVYVNMDKKLYVDAKLSEKTYNTRDQATLRIKVTDSEGNPVSAHLGVSVFDRLYNIPNDPETIITHTYLSGQIKGKIYDPGYYFDMKNTDREEALDLLLLTQGWRRYVWNEENLVDIKGKEIIFDGTKGLVINDKKRKKNHSPSTYAMIFTPDTEGESILLKPDLSGAFTVTVEDLEMSRGQYLYIKPVGPSKEKLHIDMDHPWSTINNIRVKKSFCYPIPGKEKSGMKNQGSFSIGPNTILLEEVKVKGKKTTTIRDKYMGKLDSLAKVNTPTNDYVCPYGGLNCPMHANNKDNTKPVEGGRYHIIFGAKLRDDGNWTYQSESTIIYHYPQLTDEEILKLNNLSRIKGYYGHKEFYQPDYNKDTVRDPLPDFRNTLLWNPSVITDKNGEATVRFFCSDLNTEFAGVIEGVGGTGLLGRKSFEFYVRKREKE